MIEPEMAFYDNFDNMELAEDFIKSLVQYALDNCMEDLQFLNDMFDKGLIERLRSVVGITFQRVTYTEAVDILEKSGEKFEFPVHWGTDLQSEHERYLVEKHFGKPVILTDFPKEIKAFYMKQNEDGKTSCRRKCLRKSHHVPLGYRQLALLQCQSFFAGNKS